MAKRKLKEDSASAAGDGDNKHPGSMKRLKLKPARTETPQYTSSAGNVDVDGRTDRQSSHLFKSGSKNGAERTVVGVPPTPPGLRGQARKRWRRRQRQKVLRALATPARPDPDRRDVQPAPDPAARHHQSDGFPHTSHSSKARRALLEQISRTVLVQRPTKQWIDDRSFPARQDTQIDTVRKVELPDLSTTKQAPELETSSTSVSEQPAAAHIPLTEESPDEDVSQGSDSSSVSVSVDAPVQESAASVFSSTQNVTEIASAGLTSDDDSVTTAEQHPIDDAFPSPRPVRERKFDLRNGESRSSSESVSPPRELALDWSKIAVKPSKSDSTTITAAEQTNLLPAVANKLSAASEARVQDEHAVFEHGFDLPRPSFRSRISLPVHTGPHRTMSVPSHGEAKDVRDAFRRFSAFVTGHEGESSSGDESEHEESESESESDSGQDHSVRVIAAEATDATADKSNKSRDGEIHLSNWHAINDAQRSEKVQAILADVEARQDGSKPPHAYETGNDQPLTNDDGNTDDTTPGARIEDEESDNDEHNAANETPTTNGSEREATRSVESRTVSQTSWPANVGMKRGSFLGRLGGAHFGHTQSHYPVKPTKLGNTANATRDSSDDDEDDDDVLNSTIDDVSKEVFGATRALPPSKLQSLPSSQKHHVKEPVVTDAYSGHVVAFADAYDIEQRRRSWSGLPIRPSSPVVVVCNSVQVPDHNEALFTPATTKRVLRSADSEVHQTHAENKADISLSPAVPVNERKPSTSSSSLSELSHSPTPPAELQSDATLLKDNADVASHYSSAEEDIIVAPPQPSASRKRKMTGMTSKHFSPPKPKKARREPRTEVEMLEDANLQPLQDVLDDHLEHERPRLPQSDTELPGSAKNAMSMKKRKSTSKINEHFAPTSRTPSKTPKTLKKKRLPAGTSTCLVPPITADRFGIIQEKLRDQPFWLLIAVTFLNQTGGKAAAPVFWALRERYPTPEALAAAEESDVLDMIWHLGLQRLRSKKLLLMAKIWVENPPAVGKRYKRLHYTTLGDGKQYKGKNGSLIESAGDSDEIDGTIEIAHIYGTGPYAFDSWRMFCRDVLRGLADDYNGLNAQTEDFEPEWKRVLPLDKELRACLRWMWLREGWVWDHLTGAKHRATDDEMQRARLDEMEIVDSQEQKFAAQAAAVDLLPTTAEEDEASAPDPLDEGLALLNAAGDEDEDSETEAAELLKPSLSKPAPSEVSSDNIVVAPYRKMERNGEDADDE